MPSGDVQRSMSALRTMPRTTWLATELAVGAVRNGCQTVGTRCHGRCAAPPAVPLQPAAPPTRTPSPAPDPLPSAPPMASPCSTPTADRFLPTTAAEMKARGWDAVDVVFVSGDAYIDHPSFSAALLGRLLEAVGVVIPGHGEPFRLR